MIAVTTGVWVPLYPPGEAVECVAAWEEGVELIVVAPKLDHAVLYRGGWQVVAALPSGWAVQTDGGVCQLLSDCPCSTQPTEGAA